MMSACFVRICVVISWVFYFLVEYRYNQDFPWLEEVYSQNGIKQQSSVSLHVTESIPLPESVCTCVHMCVYVCVLMRVCACVCVCVCVCEAG
jgi:hypothetical protein